MRSKLLVPLFAGFAALVFACSGRVLDAGGEEAIAPLTCSASERPFNGSCRAVCQTSSVCPTGTRCVKVDDENLCLDGESAATCSYLESDTQCLGTGGYYWYGIRGWSEYVNYPSTPPNADPTDVSPHSDSEFTASGPYSDSYSGDGCVGNAGWVTAPPDGDPACTGEHKVVRCRRFGNRCVLAAGVTQESPSP